MYTFLTSVIISVQIAASLRLSHQQLERKEESCFSRCVSKFLQSEAEAADCDGVYDFPCFCPIPGVPEFLACCMRDDCGLFDDGDDTDGPERYIVICPGLPNGEKTTTVECRAPRPTATEDSSETLTSGPVSRTIQDEHNEDGEETMAVTDESMDAPTTTITATDSVEDSGTSLPTPTGSLFVETTIITTTRLPNLSTGSASSISPSPFPSAVPHAPFTRQEKHISFGIGIGIGAPIAIALGIIAFLFWRRHRRASTNANTAATLADAHPSRPRRFRRLSVLSLVTRRSSRATRAADSAVVSTPTSASTHEKPPSELHGSDHQPYELQSREISELP